MSTNNYILNLLNIKDENINFANPILNINTIISIRTNIFSANNMFFIFLPMYYIITLISNTLVMCNNDNSPSFFF
jgi:hypothetical protein